MFISSIVKKIKKKHNETKLLNELNTDLVPFFSLKGQSFLAKVTRVIDGDTIEAVFYFKDNYYKWKIRFYDINTPETRTKDKEEKQKGTAAKLFVNSKLDNQIIQLYCYDFDSFGRLLADIYIENNINFNQELIRLGYAEKYKVKTKHS